MKTLSSIVLVGVMLLALATDITSSAAQSSAIDLGTLGGSYSTASAVNDAGQVVGWSVIAAGGYQHAFLWQDGTMMDLGTLGGFDSYALDINNLGQVVGSARTAAGEYPAVSQWHAFLWTEEYGMRDLGTLEGHTYSRAIAINDLGQAIGESSDRFEGLSRAFRWTPETGIEDLGTLGGTETNAFAINNLGQVVGRSKTAEGEWHAFLWTAQTGMQDLGLLGVTRESYMSFSRARAINDLGQVVGDSSTVGKPHAFLWQNGVMTDLGTLGGGSSTAVAINNLGQVMGQSETATREWHAFLWQNGVLTDVGTLGGWKSEANAINDLGQIVGESIDATPTWTHAFVWTIQDGMQDLSAPDVIHSSALAINNFGQAVGYGRTPSGTYHAFLWTVPLPPRSPEGQVNAIIEQVRDLVRAGSLSEGQGNALESKLDSVLRHLSRGNATPACALLQAFANQVQALMDGGVLTQAEGQPLIDAAAAVISDLCT